MLLLLSIFVLLVALVLFFVTFVIPDCFPLLGIVAWLAIVLQILSLFVPSYDYWWRMLTGLRERKPVLVEEYIVKIRDGFLPDLEAYLGDNAENGGQTYASAFRGPAFANLDLVSDDETTNDSGDSQAKAQDRQAGGPIPGNDGLLMGWSFADDRMKEVWQGLVPIFMAQEYYPCFEYSVAQGRNRTLAIGKRVALWISVSLNAAAIGFDLYRASKTVAAFFNLSIALRILFFPPISFFHIAVVQFERPRANLLAGVLRIFFVIAWVLVVATAAGVVGVSILPNLTRLNELAAPSEFLGELPPSLLRNSACQYRHAGTGLVQTIAYALGPYDIDRNVTIFNNQMQYFFGTNWSNHIQYTVYHQDASTPFIVYNDTKNNLLVFAFRGFVSGSELTVQVEMIASQYVLPIVQNIVPFLDVLGTWLGWWMDKFEKLGILFFDPDVVVVDAVDVVQRVYDELDTDGSNVVFTGINTGGLYAKVLAVTNKRPGIAFLSFPIYNDYFMSLFELSEDDAWYIINVHTSEGLFTGPEPALATNIAVPWIATPSFFDEIVISSWVRDTVYKTLCTLGELCHVHSQLDEYCLAAIGQAEVDIVNDGLDGLRW
jgi:hypothetical protein